MITMEENKFYSKSSENLYNFDTEFFRGVLAVFLVDMLEEKMTKEDVKKWIEKQLKSKI